MTHKNRRKSLHSSPFRGLLDELVELAKAAIPEADLSISGASSLAARLRWESELP